MSDKILTTATVETDLGVHERTLQRVLRLNPHLRPKVRVGTSYVWTTEEIERVREVVAAREAARKKRRKNHESATP